MRSTLRDIQAVLTGDMPATEALSNRVRAGVYLARLGVRILRLWARDRCPQQAAALAFQTALSLVPIIAIGLRAIPSEIEARVIDFLATQILPDLTDVTGYLKAFSSKISVGALGGVSIVFALVTSYTLYSSVEKIFNDIWGVVARRTTLQKFLIFYPLATLMPALAGMYLFYSGKLIEHGTAARIMGPLAIQFAALFLTNWLLPATRVGVRAALAGTLVTGVLLEALKWGFVTFAKRMLIDSYTGIYGPVALIPLLLVWIYMSWLLVLLGAEIANAIHNLRRLEAEDRRRSGEEPINALVAAQLLAFVAAAHERAGRAVPRESLADEFGLTPAIVERICERLKAKGLIAEVSGDREGYIPGRSASSIAMTDVLGAFRNTDLETARGTTSPALAQLISDLESGRRERISGVTVSDLMPEVTLPSAFDRAAQDGERKVD